MILFTENPKAAIRKLLGSSMNLIKLQDTKLIHRNLLHSYTLTMKEREIKETIPFAITSKKIKYPSINLPEEANNLYSENSKMLIKVLKDNTNVKIYHVLGLEQSTLKMSILPKAICRFNAIPIKLLMAFYTELEQKIFNLYGNTKGPELFLKKIKT